MRWYIAVYNRESDDDHEYARFGSDEEAISVFTGADDCSLLQEIYRCESDECLTPKILIWPLKGE